VAKSVPFNRKTRKAQPALTALAQKYTHPTGPEHTIIANTGKSGLTPIANDDGAITNLQRNQRRAYQRRRFYG